MLQSNRGIFRSSNNLKLRAGCLQFGSYLHGSMKLNTIECTCDSKRRDVFFHSGSYGLGGERGFTQSTGGSLRLGDSKPKCQTNPKGRFAERWKLPWVRRTPSPSTEEAGALDGGLGGAPEEGPQPRVRSAEDGGGGAEQRGSHRSRRRIEVGVAA